MKALVLYKSIDKLKGAVMVLDAEITGATAAEKMDFLFRKGLNWSDVVAAQEFIEQGYRIRA